MEIRLARIDDRLIHGQVATAWAKQININRIIVVSDEVANDSLRKFLLQEAAPPGIKSNVVTVSRMLDVYDNQLFQEQKVMLLFTNPQDVERLIRGGMRLNSLNIGGMRFTAGKRMITNFVSIDEQDADAFRYLDEQGIELEVRKVPTDRKVNLMELLDKL
ncbi:PTS system, mannose-specific IIB component [Enterococcus sp. DIV2402]|mgnify:CR=1 FL=1|jgi:PTS system mannose-specific IIB component|uniref:PTS system, mannose-specific IIB component n=1 Tax=Candidatus Enterococcus lowellii TaxID=2230877 RepID=A0ABZ2SQT9_9ENTE|nr:mannose/fructose/sorbose PTS transporter subunit IIB [Enterococcus sp. DIV2402]MBO0464957.1 PTS sugar transporter subunit IIB [Enterococcus sp. DIV2402]HPJ00753.1 mannose/fructose/sorbose PTS transporter subunit IIB [Enterococcus sp.]HPR81868.1 mannose/fructose/sorbose PTS transporter subunit IIB [Enterococcus sp.]